MRERERKKREKERDRKIETETMEETDRETKCHETKIDKQRKRGRLKRII